jgi:hypothetical protein
LGVKKWTDFIWLKTGFIEKLIFFYGSTALVGLDSFFSVP